MDPAQSVRLLRYLPHALVATFAIAVLPALGTWWLESTGAIDSPIAFAIIAIAVALTLSWAGRSLWERWSGSGDIIFGDLLIWGWLRRWVVERRLATAVGVLGLSRAGDGAQVAEMDAERKAKLLEQLAVALEARDPYTHGHSRRVARHASAVAQRLGVGPAEVARIRTAAVLHDVGKMDIPNRILHKPSRLSDEEFDVIKQHPVRGAEMVAGLRDPELTDIVLHHHERVDGNGYPGGLSGGRIPLGAKIIAVADTFDAMTSARPYRSARKHKFALDTLRREAGTQLDPSAVEAFCSYYSGTRPVLFWSGLSSIPQRFLYPLVGDLNAGGAVASVKVMAAAAAAAAAGAAALEAPGLTADVGTPKQSTATAAAVVRPLPAGANTSFSSGGQSGRGRGESAAGGQAQGNVRGSGSVTGNTRSADVGSTTTPDPVGNAGGHGSGPPSPIPLPGGASANGGSAPNGNAGPGSTPGGLEPSGGGSGSGTSGGSGSGSSGSGSSGSGSGSSGSGSSGSESGSSGSGSSGSESGSGSGSGSSGSGSSGSESGSSGSGSSGSGSGSSGSGSSGSGSGSSGSGSESSGSGSGSSESGSGSSGFGDGPGSDS